MKPRPIPLVEPFWQWQRRSLPVDTPPLPPGRHRVDVAVVGGGLAGLSTAYHLLRRQPGLRLVVLEAEGLAAGASGRTTGMLSPGVGQSLPALVRRLGEQTARALYQQTLAAVRDVQALVTAEGIDCDLQRSGQVIFARSRPQQRRLLALAQQLSALDLAAEVEILDEAALQRRLRLPRLSRGEASDGPAALRFPTAGIVDPLRLVLGLAQRVAALGGQIHAPSRVLSIAGLDEKTARASEPVCLQLADGHVRADRVVVATAGYAPKLGLFSGRLLPVQLQAVVSEPLSDATLADLGWAERDGFLDARRVFGYFRQTADRRIVFGGARPRYAWKGGDGGPAALSAAAAQVAADFAQLFPDELGIRLVGGWGGTIGYVLDALPAIGCLPHAPRIFHAVGWCGHGVALATAAGAWLAAAMSGDALPALPWFRSHLPKVPTELGRYLGFAATTRLMAASDAWS